MHVVKTASENKPSLDKFYAAKKLVDSSIHPDTLQPIFLPFRYSSSNQRMASFVPTNVPLIAFMLIPNPSMKTIIFGQWMNQSVNVCFNYSNANKSSPMTVTETALAYGTACASSCTIAVGLSEWVKRTKGLSPGLSNLLSRAVPFTAVAVHCL